MLFFQNKKNEYKWRNNLVNSAVSPSNMNMDSRIEFLMNFSNHLSYHLVLLKRTR